jgi:2-methylcitrate dehydratase PrpD
MPYTTALTLVFGDLKDEYLDSRQFLDDPRVRSLVAKVTPKIDDTLSNTNPNRLPGTLEITTNDGRTVVLEGTGHVDAGEALERAIHEKFILNVANWRGPADNVFALGKNIYEQAGIRPLMQLLR